MVRIVDGDGGTEGAPPEVSTCVGVHTLKPVPLGSYGGNEITTPEGGGRPMDLSGRGIVPHGGRCCWGADGALKPYDLARDVRPRAGGASAISLARGFPDEGWPRPEFSETLTRRSAT
jgi:hypothetical protein